MLICFFMSGFMERSLVETLLDIHYGLIEFVLFSRRCVRKNLEGAVKLSSLDVVPV